MPPNAHPHEGIRPCIVGEVHDSVPSQEPPQSLLNGSIEVQQVPVLFSYA
jgi:hypothetical protein